MATCTPVKTNITYVIPDTGVCVACSKFDGNRLLILDKDGGKAAGYNAFQSYFGVTLDLENEANWHSFFCKPCKRNIDKWQDYRRKKEGIEEGIKAHCQQLVPHEQQKRGLRSPGPQENTELQPASRRPSAKKLCFTGVATPCLEEDDSGVCLQESMSFEEANVYTLSSTPAQANPQPLQMDLSPVAPSTTAAVVVEPPPSRNRKETIRYKTSALRTKQGPIVHSIAAGSMWKALNLINALYPETVRKLFLLIILREAKLFHKLENSEALRSNSPAALINFSMENVREEMKVHAPTLWAGLCTAAKKKKGTLQLHRATTAALMLLNSRSSQLNAFQYATGILAYQQCLQKEGIEFLGRIGVSVSHTSLMRKLADAQELNDAKILTWKSAIEQQMQVSHTSQSDHDYAGPESSTTANQDISPHTSPPAPELHPGFCLVLDNLDVEVRARNMTMSNRDKSKHYVQVMAVQDRVNVEALPLEDENPVRLSQLNNSEFLPSPGDIQSMREDFVHAVSLILIEHLPAFQQAFSGIVSPGFTHRYSEVMSQKSVVLPLGIYDKSENITHELTEVMEHLHKLVPGARVEGALEGELDRDNSYGPMRPIPLGGDQVTVERERGVHRSCNECDTPEERLEGLFAMIEDFHEKMNFVELIVQKYYKKASVLEGGTLYQLKALINRTNMTNEVRQHYHAASDFIDLVTECHVMAAAIKFLQMESTESRPTAFPEDIETQAAVEKAAFLKELVSKIVDRFIYHRLGEDVERLKENVNTDANGIQDHVFNHASTLMTHGLIRRVTKMTTQAGDGDRAVRNWKYGLLSYNTTNKIKYRLEAFLLIASVSCLLPPRLSEQVKWCRYVNVSGGPWKNVDGDEAMEMLNKDAKKQIKNLGPNHTPEVVNRIGKTVKFTSEVGRELGWQVGVAPNSREHTSPSLEKDRAKIMLELTETSQVFSFIPGRQHETFREQPATIYGGIDAAKLHAWFTSKKSVYDVANAQHDRWAF